MEGHVRGMRTTAVMSGLAGWLVPLSAFAQQGGGDGAPTALIAGGAGVLLIGAGIAFMPKLRTLTGRLVVRDAFGPSEFSSTSLSVARAWSSTTAVDATPAREGLLVGLDIKRGLGRDVEVSLRFDKDGQTHTVIAGRIAPGQAERVGDLIIAYDDGRSSGSAV